MRSEELAFDRVDAVLAACLFAVGAGIARAALQQLTLDGLPTNFRLTFLSGASSPHMGLLLVIAAAAGIDRARVRRAVQVLGSILIAITLVSAGNWVNIDRVGGLGPRLGTALLILAGGLLSGAAVWLVSRAPRFSAAGSPPDAGTA